MSAPHLRGGGFQVPIEAVQPALEACGINIIDPMLLRAKCPAEAMHTTATAPGHCVIFPNSGVPRIFCHHTSCAGQVEAVNQQLRGYSCRSGGLTASRFPVSPQRGVSQARQRQRQNLQQHATRILPLVLQQYHWSAAAIAAGSPVAVTLPITQHHLYIFDLFDGTDVVWTGERVNQTGFPWHTARFRTASRWSERVRCPGAFICPDTFMPGSYSRSGQNVVARKFLVVESDTLGRDEVGAVFRMMRDELGMHLRAVVDTGRRSLHAWFDMPAPNLLEGLEAILPALGCDKAMFRPSQPCRLPGAIRPETGRHQELLYLDLSPSVPGGTNGHKTPSPGTTTP